MAAQHTDWWKDAVVYQIYPRSFQDSNGDGIGDLNGITSRLDYIRGLGVDVIWLCPIYASPNDDNGYDISNYRAIHAELGTMADFERLLAEAHCRGLRILMDLVVNHTSDEHPWFQSSRKDPSGPYGDYYIWRPGRGEGPPNNWGSVFSGSAWEKDPGTGRFYLHLFSTKQPDLNWENPAVRREVFDIMGWWLDKGVDGFRMDVINLISKPEHMPDEPLAGEYGNGLLHCANGPKAHEYLREMNERVLSQYDCMTVGETPCVTVEDARLYAGFDRNELNMVFTFEHTGLADGPLGKWSLNKTPLPALKSVLSHWQTGLHGQAWNSLYWGNHDQPRAVSKFADDRPKYRALSAKMLATCLYFMQGTPYIYQGDELGMINAGFKKLEDYRDIETLNAHRELVGGGVVKHRLMMKYFARVSRDNARTPMQWDNTAHAGFTMGEPWIQAGGSYPQINAASQVEDENSVYQYYQRLLQFRREHGIVRDGSFELLLPEHPGLFAYQRRDPSGRLVVLCNFTAKRIRLPLGAFGEGRVALCNYGHGGGLKPCEALRPYEARALWEPTA